MSSIKKKVFVGLSGGVDSSVSAALLKEAGYDVTGAFIKVWQPDWIPCSWREERRDAMRVAAKLGIPFITFDLQKEYKKEVADYMFREYKSGKTPNPDVMCNKYVKFGAFYDKARKMGADFIATGHYAQIHVARNIKHVTRNSKMLRATRYTLHTAIDTTKDQSYFLWTLNHEILAHTLFPIGGYKKSEVRALAKKFELFTFLKKDSQGLCFIGKLKMKEFLSHYIKTKSGDVLDENGKIIGRHDGAEFFTLGERHGFVVFPKSSNDAPLYVVSKDTMKNTITVSQKIDIEKAGSHQKIFLSEFNWISGVLPKVGASYNALIRYRSISKKVKILKINSKKVLLHFDKPDNTITPGQSCVIYEGNTCLGGGIISF